MQLIMRSLDAEPAFWTNSRKQRLLMRTYHAQCNPPKAILLWHHGYGEHSGRYRTRTWQASER